MLRAHFFHIGKIADFIPPSPEFRSLSSNWIELWSLREVDEDGNEVEIGNAHLFAEQIRATNG